MSFASAKRSSFQAREVEGERIDDVEQIARAMRAQEMLEHEAVVERTGALRGEIQDTQPGLALHQRVEIGRNRAAWRARRRGSPSRTRASAVAILKNGLLCPLRNSRRSVATINARVDQQADCDEQQCRFAELFHGVMSMSRSELHVDEFLRLPAAEQQQGEDAEIIGAPAQRDRRLGQALEHRAALVDDFIGEQEGDQAETRVSCSALNG